MRFTVDKSGILEKAFGFVQNEDFVDLEVFKFIYVWFEGEKFTTEGNRIMAQVSKISNRDRDVWGFDIRVEVDRSIWKELSPNERKKLCYHELKHIVPIMDKEDNNIVATDKEGRYKYKLVKHDISLLRFKDELKKFGLSGDEVEIRDFLNTCSEDANKPKKAKKKKKKALDKA